MNLLPQREVKTFLLCYASGHVESRLVLAKVFKTNRNASSVAKAD